MNQIRSKPKDLFQDWVRYTCSIRQQNELAKAIRGPDAVDGKSDEKTLKESSAKPLCQAFRACVEVDGSPGTSSFFKIDASNIKELDRRADVYFSNINSYPQHFRTHFMVAIGILANKYPGPINPMKVFWHNVYKRACECEGIEPSTESELDTKFADSV